MTEQEWKECTDPEKMLEFLKDKASDRKLRLFAVACCRGIWHLISDNRSRQAVETAEHAADGKATDQEQATFNGGRYFEAQFLSDCLMSAVGAAGWSVARSLTTTEASHCAADAWQAVVHNAIASSAIELQQLADEERYHAATEPLRQSTKRLQASLLRDIFPWSERLPVQGSWLLWRDSTIPKLAQSAYDNRQLPSGHLDPTLLAFLADALEEAGCLDAVILGHLRGPGVHVRGCWVIDLLTGRK